MARVRSVATPNGIRIAPGPFHGFPPNCISGAYKVCNTWDRDRTINIVSAMQHTQPQWYQKNWYTRGEIKLKTLSLAAEEHGWSPFGKDSLSPCSWKHSYQISTRSHIIRQRRTVLQWSMTWDAVSSHMITLLFSYMEKESHRWPRNRRQVHWDISISSHTHTSATWMLLAPIQGLVLLFRMRTPSLFEDLVLQVSPGSQLLPKRVA